MGLRIATKDKCETLKLIFRHTFVYQSVSTSQGELVFPCTCNILIKGMLLVMLQFTTAGKLNKE